MAAPWSFETSRQDSQAHDLDQADVFLLMLWVLLVRVEDTVGVFLAGAVVAQRQVQHITVLLVIMQDRGDGVVRGIAGMGQDADACIAVFTPGAQDIVGSVLHLL